MVGEPRSERAATARRVTLEGVLEREIYASDDRSFVVAELVEKGGRERHVVAGDLGACSIGDTVAIEGVPVTHPRFGAQVRVHSVRWIPPASAEGMRRLLGSGSIKGVGKVTAERIVARFGADTLRILDEEPQRLREVKGVSRKRVELVQLAWKARRALHAENAFLAGLGLGPAMSERVRKSLGQRAIARLRDDPWLLAREVDGIGFRRADEIARRLEQPADAPPRIEAGLAFALAESADEGHCFSPRSLLVQDAQRLLGLPLGPIEDRLDAMLERRAFVRDELGAEEDAIFLPRLHAAEVEVAHALAARAGELLAKERVDAERALAWTQPRLGIALTEDQRLALRQLFNARTGVLTGGPGVGKTTIVRALVEVFERKGLRLALAAPTGRAARRLAEASGRSAATLHRLLQFDPRRGRFVHGLERPLPLDALIVDEASMVDLLLMRDLLRATPASARLILVGDADQLPSVGPGDVLHALIESGIAPVARLTRILRQSEGSSIVRAAHSVLHGEIPEFESGSGEGAFFVERDNVAAAQRSVLEIVSKRLPRGFGFDARRDVQVLAPMNRGPLGIGELNEVLQSELNPAQVGLFPGAAAIEGALRPGDRVLQTRNNYDLEVMNGEIGVVVEREGDGGPLTVEFEDRKVVYPVSALNELQLAYAITVHKSQGCEFEAVVLVLSMQHFVLLRRNLLYTAITRAKRVLVVVGARRALQRAVEMGQVERRRSLLEARLRLGGAA